jgi:predicted DNA repair protein MutK
MASSLLALLDDIAVVLDDVALLTKVAAQKTAGVLGDDLALNAQQVAGVRAERELPVVWAVAKGSLRNKVILVPGALLISALMPALITPLLMVGGAYLCFEGVEKLAHKLFHGPAEQAAHEAELMQALADPGVDLAQVERDKIQGAVRTDFILSAEIVAITLGTVAQAPWLQQFTVLAGVALLMTVGVYGLVGAIVKLDDAGLWLMQRPASGWQQALGRALVGAAPRLMKLLTVVGTWAMFLVGGGILAHGWPALHHATAHVAEGWPPLAAWLWPFITDTVLGVAAGAAVLALVSFVHKLRRPAA